MLYVRGFVCVRVPLPVCMRVRAHGGSLYAPLRFVALLPGLKLTRSGTILVLPVRVKTGGKLTLVLNYTSPVRSCQVYNSAEV